MPTYAYECSACGHRFEEFQSMTAAPLKKCPACAKSKLQRLIGAGAGVIFKGSGFYQTDYKNAGDRKRKESDGEGTSASKPDGGKKTEGSQDATKPAAKTESKPEPKSEKGKTS